MLVRKGIDGNTRLCLIHFWIKWFVRDVYRQANDKDNQREGVRGYPLRGKWFDIGTDTDLIAANLWFGNNIILKKVTTVADLRLAQENNMLTDHYFLLCRELEIDGQKREIRIYFKSSDKICKLRESTEGDIPSVEDIKTAASHEQNWELLEPALYRKKKFRKQALKYPLLISGGVFLFDTHGSRLDVDEQGLSYNILSPDRTLLPLLEKDLGAPTDPGRLTTSAGRMDILDLRQVCYGELCEEFIFYGTEQLNGQMMLYVCAPDEFHDIRRRTLNRILDRGIEIPGLERARIEYQAKMDDENIDIVQRISPNELILPKSQSWSVEIYLDDILQSRCDGVVTIPDKQNGTLEFRIVSTADLSHFNPRIGVDLRINCVGRLMGIADGDGYQRRPFLMHAGEVRRYYKGMLNRTRDELLDYLFDSQRESARVFAIGDSKTGRLSQFKAPVPVLSFTTSVKYLMNLIDYIVK